MYWILSPELVLGLMSVRLEPLRRCSDGRWRSQTLYFPTAGLSSHIIDKLIEEGLVEKASRRIALTAHGADALDNRIRTSHAAHTAPRVSAVSH
jgi:hypothetical protein